MTLEQIITNQVWREKGKCMCTFFQDNVLWACLATMAAYAKDLNTAETAYAAIDEVCTKALF